MLPHFACVVLLQVFYQVCQVESSDTYNYKLSQMYAGMFSELEAGYLRETEGLLTILEGYSELSKALPTYQQAITKAQGTACDTNGSAAKTQAYKDALQVSRKECQNLPTCETDLGRNTKWILKSTHELDVDLTKDANGCTDVACKRKAYDNLRKNLGDLYEDFMPAMHLGATVNLAETICSSEIISCFNNKNSNHVKEIQAEISKLEAYTAKN